MKKIFMAIALCLIAVLSIFFFLPTKETMLCRIDGGGRIDIKEVEAKSYADYLVEENRADSFYIDRMAHTDEGHENLSPDAQKIVQLAELKALTDLLNRSTYVITYHTTPYKWYRFKHMNEEETLDGLSKFFKHGYCSDEIFGMKYDIVKVH